MFSGTLAPGVAKECIPGETMVMLGASSGRNASTPVTGWRAGWPSVSTTSAAKVPVAVSGKAAVTLLGSRATCRSNRLVPSSSVPPRSGRLAVSCSVMVESR